jgi:hypothetical protein
MYGEGGFPNPAFVVVENDRLHDLLPDVMLGANPDARVDINLAQAQRTDFSGSCARER